MTDELQELIDGTLEGERFADVQARLKTDPALLQRYLAAVRADHLLKERFGSEKIVAFPAQRRRGIIAVISAAAAAIVAALVVIPMLKQEIEVREGEAVTMHEGRSSFTLASGVEAAIENPASFEVTGSNQLKLDGGQGRFRVPEGAIGFTVEMPGMRVVDLGTVFTAGVDGPISRVEVEEGKVEVHFPGGSKAPKLLVAGETISVGGDVFHEQLTHERDQAFRDRDSWTVADGDPQVRGGKFDAQGQPAAVFAQFVNAGGSDEIVVAIRARSPKGAFHSEGWAGISLFEGDHEFAFFGDKFGESDAWSVVAYGDRSLPGGREDAPEYDLPIRGAEQTFTIRYRQKTGEIDIFHGWGVHGAPVQQLLTSPGVTIDRIRVACGQGGDFSFDELRIWRPAF